MIYRDDDFTETRSKTAWVWPFIYGGVLVGVLMMIASLI